MFSENQIFILIFFPSYSFFFSKAIQVYLVWYRFLNVTLYQFCNVNDLLWKSTYTIKLKCLKHSRIYIISIFSHPDLIYCLSTEHTIRKSKTLIFPYICNFSTEEIKTLKGARQNFSSSDYSVFHWWSPSI